MAIRLVGVGYRASLEGQRLILKVGFSHDVVIPVPSDIKVSVPIATRIIVQGVDLQRVTQFAAIVRSKRKPEPFGGKGIFVGNETIKLKEGKKKK